MSVKVKVSYEHDDELSEIVRLLSPVLRNVKVQKKKGKYRRAYIMLTNANVEIEKKEV